MIDKLFFPDIYKSIESLGYDTNFLIIKTFSNDTFLLEPNPPNDFENFWNSEFGNKYLNKGLQRFKISSSVYEFYIIVNAYIEEVCLIISMPVISFNKSYMQNLFRF